MFQWAHQFWWHSLSSNAKHCLKTLTSKNIDRNSANFVHIMTEVQRLAYADRSIHLGDPDFWDNPIDMLTSKEYANGD